MEKNIHLSEKLLCLGYMFILLFMVVQDLVPLGRLNDMEAVASVHSFNDILVTTLIGAVQIGLLLGGILFFMGKRYPVWARIWLIIHPSCILLGAIMSWWIPYLSGIGAEEKIMFGNTHAFLPVMNGIVPNTLHTVFHFVLLACIMLTVYIFSIKKASPDTGQVKGVRT